LILTSGLLGDPASSASFFSYFVIDSPLSIFGDAIVLIGEEDELFYG